MRSVTSGGALSSQYFAMPVPPMRLTVKKTSPPWRNTKLKKVDLAYLVNESIDRITPLLPAGKQRSNLPTYLIEHLYDLYPRHEQALTRLLARSALGGTGAFYKTALTLVARRRSSEAYRQPESYRASLAAADAICRAYTAKEQRETIR